MIKIRHDFLILINKHIYNILKQIVLAKLF